MAVFDWSITRYHARATFSFRVRACVRVCVIRLFWMCACSMMHSCYYLAYTTFLSELFGVPKIKIPCFDVEYAVFARPGN